MQKVRPALGELADELQDAHLKRLLEALTADSDIESLQRLHREALLQMQTHVGR